MTVEDEKVRFMLYDKRIGKWLAVLRIQSAPLTILPVLIGYFIAESTYSLKTVGVLSLISLLGHLAMYGHNEYCDFKYDMENKDAGKPLTEGSIKRENVRVVAVVLLGVSLAITVYVFPILVATAFGLGAICGFLYNKQSKVYPYSPAYMGIWGVTAIFTGAFTVADAEATVIVYALGVGFFITLLTYIADLKDIESNEASLPKRMGSRVVYSEDARLIHVTSMAQFTGWMLLMGEVMMFAVYILVLQQYSVVYAVFPALGVILIYLETRMMASGKKTNKQFKMEFAGFTLAQCFLLLTTASVNIPTPIILGLVVGSCVWVFGWLFIIYSDPLYFP